MIIECFFYTTAAAI